jgi:hypothetical protein
MLTFADGSHQQERLHLFEPVSTTASIERVIRRLMERFVIKSAVCRVEIGVTHLVSNAPRQLELFTQKPVRQQLIDLAHLLTDRYRGADFLQSETRDADALDLERRVHFRKVNVS